MAVNGNFSRSGGTSASAPIFASVIASINDARIAAGKKTVGWINPAVRPTKHSERAKPLTWSQFSSSTPPRSRTPSTT